MFCSQHLHADDILQWLKTVEQRYDDFSARYRKYEQRLFADLGGPDTSANHKLTLDSDPTLKAKIRDAAVEFDDARRKSARKRECIMNELLTTEEAYVRDLQRCMDEYEATLVKDPKAPQSLKDKRHVIFANLDEIHKFHREWVAVLIVK